MAFSQKKHLARYMRLRERQPSTGWSSEYEAAIRATRTEAPTISRPTRISSRNRFGRQLHALSIPERTAILLALFNPNVFDLREQFVLCPAPSPHPMQGHPRFAGVDLPSLPGMVHIYEGIGMLDAYPVIRSRADGDSYERPDLFVADLVLGVEDRAGAYCVHWSVKADESGFKGPQTKGTLIRDPRRASEKFTLRMRGERLYFAAAGIPTREFVGDRINAKLIANLLECFGWSTRDSWCANHQAVRALIVSTDLCSVAPLELALYAWGRFGVTQEAFKVILYTLVWQRLLRVDLFTRLRFDAPWPAERKDPLVEYDDLFRR